MTGANDPGAASFRDPSGSCRVIGERVLRWLGAEGAGRVEAFLQTPSAQGFIANRQLVSSRRLDKAEAARLRELTHWEPRFGTSAPVAIFEHERIPFQSYPYEWPPEMLWRAGCLTLDLAMTVLEDGYGLKDATPYNILFRGCDPVFIDVPSFEPRRGGDPLWLPYAQFVRTFLLPLFVNRRWGLTLADLFITHRDGIEPQEVYRMCGPFERLRPQTLSLISIPTWLQPRARAGQRQLYEPKKLQNEEKAQFIVRSLLTRARRTLDSLKPPAAKQSLWSDYQTTHSYNDAALAAKRQFVAGVLADFKPKRVLDAGANTGSFSVQAAKSGAEVVAIDLDPACVGMIWGEANAQKLNILPLVVDMSRPSPALGWRNQECPSFLERAAGSFDCVFMLAFIHHLLVTERIPLDEIIWLASELTTSILVVEFVAPEDAMFRELTRGRDELYAGLNQRVFETTCAAKFEIIRSQPLPDTRRHLYALKRKQA